MAASREWTEWHLSKKGWVSGSKRRDSAIITEKEPPSNRVLSCRFNEEFSTGSFYPYKFVEEVWRGDQEDLVEDLLSQYGACPETL